MNKLPYYLEAALSFRSIKDLNKRYPQFFKNVTMGYEAEVSQGDLNTSEGDPIVSANAARESFERHFEYNQSKFLRDNFRGAIDIIKTFEVEFLYGYAKDDYQKPLGSLLSLVNSRFAYKVMKFENPETNTIEYVVPYISLGLSGLRQFTRESNADNYDQERIINVATNYRDLLVKFIAKYKVNTSFMELNIDQLTSYIMEYVDSPDKEDDSEKLLSVYYIGKKIAYINSQLKLFYNAMEGTDIYSSNIGVLDENGALVILKMDSYEYGLLNPLVKDFDSDAFDNDYQTARESAYDSEFDEFMESYSENNSSSLNSEKIVETIHNYVVSDVDDKAEFSSDYHSSATSAYRGKVTIVESDSSISPPGAEIVSPVFNGLTNSFVWLDKVFDMIEHRGMETNRSTGLHVNIGTFRALHKAHEGDGFDYARPVIDVVKLAVLSGDHYLLEQFGRLGNTYALSISSNIRDLAQSNFDFKEARKSGMTDIITELNRKLIIGQGDRYRTINMQNLLDKGYLEFRIAGNSGYEKDRAKIKKAVYRYVQLCAIACDPQAYFKEYMTELYRLFVDNSSYKDIQEASKINKEPKPKNLTEAMYIIRSWSSKYAKQGNGALPYKNLEHVRQMVQNNAVLPIHEVLDLISGLNADIYPKVTTNLLYSLRLLMIYCAKEENSPKDYLKNLYPTLEKPIKDYVAPKLYRNKPQWIRYLFTGTMTGM